MGIPSLQRGGSVTLNSVSLIQVTVVSPVRVFPASQCISISVSGDTGNCIFVLTLSQLWLSSVQETEMIFFRNPTK